jgi:hypothetical protein
VAEEIEGVLDLIERELVRDDNSFHRFHHVTLLLAGPVRSDLWPDHATAVPGRITL